jgi:hypothetical protein
MGFANPRRLGLALFCVGAWICPVFGYFDQEEMIKSFQVKQASETALHVRVALRSVVGSGVALIPISTVLSPSRIPCFRLVMETSRKVNVSVFTATSKGSEQIWPRRTDPGDADEIAAFTPKDVPNPPDCLQFSDPQQRERVVILLSPVGLDRGKRGSEMQRILNFGVRGAEELAQRSLLVKAPMTGGDPYTYYSSARGDVSLTVVFELRARE